MMKIGLTATGLFKAAPDGVNVRPRTSRMRFAQHVNPVSAADHYRRLAVRQNVDHQRFRHIAAAEVTARLVQAMQESTKLVQYFTTARRLVCGAPGKPAQPCIEPDD